MSVSFQLLFVLSCFLVVTPPLAAQSSHDAIEKVLPRVVKIYGAGGLHRLEGYSTGFLVSSEGHIVTVWNHVLDTNSVRVVLNDGQRFEAKVLGAEPPLDLAVLQLEGEHIPEDLPYFNLEKAGTAQAGSRVLAFSNMYKVATGDEPVSVLHGVIASHTQLTARRGVFRTSYDGPVYIVDAITNNPGAAGGVLTTYDGTLLGMIGKQLRNAKSNTWVNYAIPATEFQGIVEQIISGDFSSSKKKPEQEENPNRYRPIDFGLVMVPDVIYRTPAYVDTVLPGSPAAEAGIRPDDLVVFINDELVQSCRRLKEELGWLEEGDRLNIVVRRNDQLVSFQLQVERNENSN